MLNKYCEFSCRILRALKCPFISCQQDTQEYLPFEFQLHICPLYILQSTLQPPRDLKQILYRFQLCNDVDGAMPHIFVAFPLLKQTYLAGWDNLILKWKSICYRGIKSMNMISINTIIKRPLSLNSE